ISIEELPDLAKYLDREYKVAIREIRREEADKIERLQYGVNFIFEARREGYKVNYKTKYIEQIS
ncbi:MAG: pPPM1a, partial [Paenibacillus sp.]|nr:pPPM1a [Paenibacillus sp.]